MKPNFALTLSFDGIGLLHRAHPGWHLVGDVALDSDDLTAALADLRARARALDPSGLTTKLVIPNAQIKYLSFAESAASGDTLEDEVRRQLDGTTPYGLDELIYDWSVGAGQVHVAAVARETLTEAATFAREHEFNPLCFVAIPDNGHFVGEPFFGETADAGTLIPEGDRLTRDSAPIRILGAATLPDPDAPPAEAVPETDRDEAEAPIVAPEVEDAPQDDAADRPEAGTTEPATPEHSDLEDATPEAAMAKADAPEEPAPSLPEGGDDGDDGVAFTSIRASREATPPVAAPRLAGAARDAGTPAKPAAPVTGTPDTALPEETATDLAASLRPDPETRRHDSPTEAATEGAGANPGKGLLTGFRTQRDKSQAPQPKATAKRKDKATPAAAMAPTGEDRADEARRMTIFGAREDGPVRGKPRYLGLILTAVLLLFLVSVAAWASIFMEDGLARFFRDDDTQIAATPEVETGIASPEDAARSDAGDEAAVTGDEAEATGDAGEVDLASLPQGEADTRSDAETRLSQPAPVELTPDEARARYAATGIWQRAPRPLRAPRASSLDGFYQTSIDSNVPSSDAVALPPVAALDPDARPPTPASPAAAGTTYRLDERGMVLATPEGALTPSGVPVYAGAPPLIPDVFPDRPGAIALPQSPEELQRLMGVRPKVRPGDLAEQNERGQLGLGGRTRTELAVLRPKLRPESAQEAAARAARTEAVAEALEDDADQQEADAFASATPQAVAASLKPASRPRNFDKVVKQAERRAASEPVSASQRIAPSAPTGTTVARAATERNQVNLRQVNLIGVYGTPSNRRALVRLSNGRYKKVKVGDRLDRGRVTAIGDSQLRYKKGSRNVVLRLPRG
jgi:hypothetical protein